MAIILASASPRRRELLENVGVHDMVIIPAHGEEHAPEGAGAAEAVMAISRGKALEVAEQCSAGDVIIAADTVVCLDGDILGKPCDEAEAADMLRRLSGREHVATGEPMDKAGAYGAQGVASLFVEGITGDFFNVMGLPMCVLGRMLSELGVSLL